LILAETADPAHNGGVPQPEHPARWIRRRSALLAALPLVLLTIACDRQPPRATLPPTQIVTIFAPTEMEPIIRVAEAAARDQQLGWQIDLQTGGAQTFAWRIEGGELPDLFIASSIEMAEELIPMPTRIEPWLDDPLVVISRADDPDPILAGERALERSTGPVAIGGGQTQLGILARVAMRYAEIWPLVERRTTHRTDAPAMIEALLNNEVDLAVLYASDAAIAGPGIRISEQLELPEGVRTVYTLAPYSDLGSRFAELLLLPKPIEQATTAGYLPAPAPATVE
jgi:ABC-type molybdate transport system substrate-binding protein